MQKLELTWIGKENEPQVEPRILLHDSSRDYGDSVSANMLIHGDNLLALKALEQEFTGKVKCIYIDPPYNTGAAFEHYNDNLEHSTWLSLMVPRLKILRSLLSDDGSIWISIDDDEGHYLKVLCDEIFGRRNFINTVIWEKKFSPQNDAKWLSDSHDFVLVYAKNKEIWRPNLLPRTEEMNNRYKNPDYDPRGLWTSGDVSVKTYNASTDYPITTPSGRVVNPPAGYCWRYSKEKFKELVLDNRIWFGSNGDNVPRIKRFLTDVKKGMTAMTLWKYKDVGHNQDARKEVVAFNSHSVFTTPKPERLIERILTLGSNEKDLVLDSFLGSGTTAAVAHKMGRRWIGIELGDHCYTHCIPRLKAVVDGEQGGISKTVSWEGGSGFKFYELAPTLIVTDKYGQPVFNDKYNSQMLVAAVVKLHGFYYAPDTEVFWKQGKSLDNSYIYVTSQYLSAEHVDTIARELTEQERLLICAPAFDLGLNKRYENIDVKKIPQSVLRKCEYGVDNYDLNIVDPPEFNVEECDDAKQ